MKKTIFTQAQIEEISNEFNKQLREWISPSDMVKVIKRNERYAAQGKKDVCATHEFIDANMAMDGAFTKVIGFEVNLQDNAQTELWGKVWALSMENKFVIK